MILIVVEKGEIVKVMSSCIDDSVDYAVVNDGDKKTPTRQPVTWAPDKVDDIMGTRTKRGRS